MSDNEIKYLDTINKRFEETLSVLKETKNSSELISKAADNIYDSFKNGHKLLICGNGGSAADAQHIAAEFIGKFYKIDRPALPAIALTTNTSILTAIGNDFSYDMVFIRQVEALAQQGDILFGISTSGNSANIIEAAKLAREKGAYVISLTGDTGGKLNEVSDLIIKVPSNNTPIVQNAHITICHIICEIVESLF